MNTSDPDGSEGLRYRDGVGTVTAEREPAVENEPDEADAEGTGLKSALAVTGSWFRRHIVFSVVLALVLAACGGGFAWYSRSHVPDGVAYRVAGEDIKTQALEEEVDALRSLYGVQPPASGPELDAFRRDSAKASAVGRILDRAATERNIVIGDREASDVLDRYVNQFFGEGGAARDNFVQALGTAGTSERAVLREIKRQLAVSRLFDQVAPRTPIGDGELRIAFDQRRQELATPETRQIKNIVVGSRAGADQVVARLNNGEAFADVARDRSLDSSTKEFGGDIGWIAAGQLEEPYAKAAFAAAPNGVFGPVQTSHGWNVGVVVGIKPSQPAEFDKIKEQLRQQVAGERSSQRWREWLGEQISDADVVYADEYRPADPNALPGAGGGRPVPAAPGQAPEPPR